MVTFDISKKVVEYKELVGQSFSIWVTKLL